VTEIDIARKVTSVVSRSSTATPAETSTTYRQLRRELLDIESAALTGLYETGAITGITRRRIQRTLDLEHTGHGDQEQLPATQADQLLALCSSPAVPST
jgi:hypothetical protein